MRIENWEAVAEKIKFLLQYSMKLVDCVYGVVKRGLWVGKVSAYGNQGVDVWTERAELVALNGCAKVLALCDRFLCSVSFALSVCSSVRVRGKN